MPSSLPDCYLLAGEDELVGRIKAAKARMGRRLVILAHHYQRLEIVRLGDYIGDSLGLSKTASRLPEAEYIVFCGVRFMAEAARILCRPEQKVYLPNPLAGCPMADMGPIDKVNEAWERIRAASRPDSIIPISYMNTSAELKAFTGLNGGLICTSTNAEAAFRWALERAPRLFFFPDQHLGRNTAKRLGFQQEQVYLYSPESAQTNGVCFDKIKVILWPGYCYVHTKFTKDHVDRWRALEPKVKIVVHPECREEVVARADAVGSTSFIVKYVENLPAGSIVAIGTELNLVHRLAEIHGDKSIFELSDDTCPICSNMFRTTLADLCYTVENLDKAQNIIIEDNIKDDARIGLERMLDIGG
jgi:quinolinate synthase